MGILNRNIFDYEDDYEVWENHLSKVIKKREKIKEEILDNGRDDLDYSLRGLPSRYKIRLETYRDMKDERLIDYLKVIILENNEEILSFIRNDNKMSMIYEKVNEDYLFCTGESSRGITIINLNDKTKYSIIPDYNAWMPIDIIQFDKDEMELSVRGMDDKDIECIRVFKIEDLSYFDLETFVEYDKTKIVFK